MGQGFTRSPRRRLTAQPDNQNQKKEKETMLPETIEMTPDKECKGTRRFAADKPNAPIKSVYVERSEDIDKAKKLILTLSTSD